MGRAVLTNQRLRPAPSRRLVQSGVGYEATPPLAGFAAFPGARMRTCSAAEPPLPRSFSWRSRLWGWRPGLVRRVVGTVDLRDRAGLLICARAAASGRPRDGPAWWGHGLETGLLCGIRCPRVARAPGLAVGFEATASLCPPVGLVTAHLSGRDTWPLSLAVFSCKVLWRLICWLVMGGPVLTDFHPGSNVFVCSEGRALMSTGVC